MISNLLFTLNEGAKTQLLNRVFTVLSSRGPDPSSCFYLFECLSKGAFTIYVDKGEGEIFQMSRQVQKLQ